MLAFELCSKTSTPKAYAAFASHNHAVCGAGFLVGLSWSEPSGVRTVVPCPAQPDNRNRTIKGEITGPSSIIFKRKMGLVLPKRC